MKCVKTGLMFRVPELLEETFHGDMFYNTMCDVYVIRGIAKGTSNNTPQVELRKHGDAYGFLTITDDFSEWFFKCNHMEIQHGVRISPVIIDDERFF